MELGHPSIQADEPTIVVTRIAIIASDATPLRKGRVVRRDQTTFTSDHHLRGRETEHFCIAKSADALAAAYRSEGVRGVEDETKAVAPSDADERLGLTGVAKIAEVRTPIALDTDSGERVRVSGSTSAKTGRKPFHATACAVAANVKDGTMTSPERSRARRTSIRPAVHDDTATQCRTPRYSAARRSSSRTCGPFVRTPEERTPEKPAATTA
jgi:hypothetical protein